MEGKYINGIYIPHNIEIDDRESKIVNRRMKQLIRQNKFCQFNGKQFKDRTHVIVSSNGIEFYSDNVREIDNFIIKFNKPVYVETVGSLIIYSCY
jgi:hypothetical protein